MTVLHDKPFNVPKGSLGALWGLYLSSNKIGDAVSAFSDAIARGALANLTYLGLGNNQIGDAGMSEFSRAIASGSLANLQFLGITNPSDELQAHCSSRRISLV